MPATLAFVSAFSLLSSIISSRTPQFNWYPIRNAWTASACADQRVSDSLLITARFCWSETYVSFAQILGEAERNRYTCCTNSKNAACPTKISECALQVIYFSRDGFRGAIEVIVALKTYESNFIHHYFVRFGKQHSWYKIIRSFCCTLFCHSQGRMQGGVLGLKHPPWAW